MGNLIGEGKTTGTLYSELFSTMSFVKFLRRNSPALSSVTYAEYIARLYAEKGVLRRELYSRLQIERGFAHQIDNGQRRATRDHVLKVALGLNLSVEECQRLLTLAGRSTLYPRVPRDAALLQCLHFQLGYHEAQTRLSDHGMTALGAK